MSGLVQTQFNTSNRAGADATELLLRRVRLGASERISPIISGRIQAELANAAEGGSAELNEAYALAQFTPAFGILVGKGGRPFGIIDATAAANLVPIERGARFRGAETVELYRTLEALAYAGRSVGVQVLGEAGSFVYAGGYFSGATGEEGADADIRQVAARVQYEFADKVLIGVAASNRAYSRDDPPGVEGSDARGANPSGESKRASGFALDVQIGAYGEPGVHVVAEAALGVLDPYLGHDFRAFQAWAAFRSRVAAGPLSAVEPLIRFSIADADGPLGQDEGFLLTPGLNLYADGNTRLALNADVFFPAAEDVDPLFAFRAQVQIAF